MTQYKNHVCYVCTRQKWLNGYDKIELNKSILTAPYRTIRFPKTKQKKAKNVFDYPNQHIMASSIDFFCLGFTHQYFKGISMFICKISTRVRSVADIVDFIRGNISIYCYIFQSFTEFFFFSRGQKDLLKILSACEWRHGIMKYSMTKFNQSLNPSNIHIRIFDAWKYVDPHCHLPPYDVMRTKYMYVKYENWAESNVKLKMWCARSGRNGFNISILKSNAYLWHWYEWKFIENNCGKMWQKCENCT